MGSMSLQSSSKGSFTVNQGRIEDGDADITLIQQHPYLGTTKDKTITALINQSLRDPFMRQATFLANHIATQLVIDDAVCFRSIIGLRNCW